VAQSEKLNNGHPEPKADLVEYIQVFYNLKRLHGYLGYVSRVDFEENGYL